MFALTTNVSASYRVIATLVATAMVMSAMGVYNYAQAANVTYFSDTLSDSDKGVDSNHTITFRAPSGITVGQTILLTFPAGFDLTGVTTADYSQTVNGVATTTFTEGAVVGQTVTLTRLASALATTATTSIIFNGTNKINNPPTTGSYQIDIAGTMADSGHTRVAIVDNIDVTAKVNTSFNFTVIGNATTTSVNGTTTTRTTSSTTIPFGTLAAGAGQILAQDLTVQTNAIHGFVVTVMEDQNLLSSTGADIDNFVQGVTSGTPVVWSAPTNNIALENTWGHWGMTSEDTSTTRGVQFASNLWVGVSTTPQVIFSHTGPSDGSTAGIGRTRIGYKAQITPLQEAGDDYSTTLTYVATPTF
jgi:hypothetical protein